MRFLSSLAAALAVSLPAHAQDELEPLVAELRKLRDDADEELVSRIADLKTRRAMEALVALYDEMGSTFMKREIVCALATFDGVDDAEQPALEKVANVAMGAQKRLLRLSAVEALAGCPDLGKVYLRRIVDSPADDEIRERALELHLAMAAESDLPWYREIFEARPGDVEDLPKRKRRRAEQEEEGAPVLHRLESLRERAFGAIAEGMSDDELAELVEEDENETIQLLALQALHARGSRRAKTFALEMFEDNERGAQDRAVAARILADIEGPSIANEFLDHAKKQAVTQEHLREAMAEILSSMQDPALDRKLEKLLGRGKLHQKVFALLACRRIEDPDVDEKYLKALGEEEDEVWEVAVRVVAERGLVEAVPELEEQLQEAEEGDAEERILTILGALSAIRGEDPEWLARLDAYARSDSRVLRNATLRQLARADARYLPLVLEALSHDDWSTRLTALRALEELRVTEGVGAIVARMSEEEGRMLHAFADALWSLTGQPFGLRVEAWQSWWKREGADFQVIAEEELALLEEEEEARRLREVTSTGVAEFFGIQIVSHRVLFLVDVSGSMAFSLREEVVGEEAEVRFDVARRELKATIDQLDPGAFFNIITFSTGAAAWVDGVVDASEEHKRAAFEYIDRLGALGGTNVYAALDLAFRDPDVDTLVLLSDGEPEGGMVDDTYMLREIVAEWNENRGVAIHAVSIGGSLQLLSWLAEDHGGTYVEFD